MTQTDETDTLNNNCPASLSLKSHSRRIAIIKQALDMIAILLSLTTALFLTSKLIGILSMLLAMSIGALCLIIVGSLSQVIIDLAFGNSPSNGWATIILDAILTTILEALSRVLSRLKF